jgi:hypothetical protein
LWAAVRVDKFAFATVPHRGQDYDSYTRIRKTLLVLDAIAIQNIESDYVDEDEVILAGGVKHPVSIYLCDVAVDTLRLTEVEIMEMQN